MKITVSSNGDWDDTEKWLQKAMKLDPTSGMNKIGRDGERALVAATPVRYGELARGWSHNVDRTGLGFECVWTNSAHPETPTPLVLMLHYGHGTGTGGYVQPNDFINPAIGPILDKAGDVLLKELMK